MKHLVILTMFFGSIIANASDAVFEIPYDEKDYRPSQIKIHQMEVLVKEFECEGKTYGIAYSRSWGWANTTRFLGVCRWDLRSNINTCTQDSDPGAVACYHKVVDTFALDTDPSEKTRNIAGHK